MSASKVICFEKNEKSLVAHSNVHTLHRWPYENKKMCENKLSDV